MKNAANRERLARAIEEAQSARRAFLALIEPLSQALLDHRPAAGAWSPGEVAHHVLLTEGLLAAYLKELLHDADPLKGAQHAIPFDELPMGPRAIPTPILRIPGMLLPFSMMSSFIPQSVQNAFLADAVVKVKTAPQLEPQHGIARKQLLDDLQEARAETLSLLAPVQDWDLSQFRWSHPLMGTHDVYGTLELLASHDQRHARQIQKTVGNQ